MPEMVICKSCGYVMEKSRVGDTCPACGVPSKMFMPHDERISPKRKMLLSLDVHPVMVHFPQAFTATILLLSLAGAVLRGPAGLAVCATVKTLGVILPFTVVLAFASGVFDGTIRFRKVTTPLLRKKMALGTLFFLIGLAILFAVRFLPFTVTTHFLVIAGLSLPALGCAAGLGLMGTSLLNARFPG
jgi:hypothetical protein